MVVSSKLKELFPEKFWLYVDGSKQSEELIKDVEPFVQADMLVIYDIYKDGGFKGTDVPLPRLLRNGDVATGLSLRKFIQHLKELNEELLREEVE